MPRSAATLWRGGPCDGLTNTVTPGSDYDYAAGVITDYDVSQAAINHIVRLAISPDALKSPGADWMQNIPWPNNHEDYNGPRDYTGSIVAGSTFGIPMSVNLDSLGLSQGGLMLAKALQNYGGLWRDQGGTNQVTFYSTPENENNPLIQQMRADMAKIVPVIEIMRNQGPNSVNGGGTPVVPPLPPVSLGGVIIDPPPPPTPITFGTGPDSLVFQISEDAYANGDGTSDAKGDATFTVSIDGKQIGGTFTAAGSHAAGQEQAVTLNGYFGPGTHSVAVNFLNDAYSGTPATDRNLYVDSVTYNGLNTNQSAVLYAPTAIFYASGAQGFTVSGGTSLNTITGTAGNDTLTGGAGNDTLIGLGGNDTLIGGAGVDTMIGGTGNDLYYVDNAADVVTEAVGQGTDTVMASVNYTLAAGTEVEALRANATTGLIRYTAAVAMTS